MQTFFDGITKRPNYELPMENFEIKKRQDDYIIYNKDSGGWIICNKEELTIIFSPVTLKDFSSFLYKNNIIKKNGNYFDPAESFFAYDWKNTGSDYNISDTVLLIYLEEDNFDEAINKSIFLKDGKILYIFINSNRKHFLSSSDYDKEVKYFDNCIDYMIHEEKSITDIDILEVILNIYQCKQLSSIVALVKKEKCENAYYIQNSILEECCNTCKNCMYKAICRYKPLSEQPDMSCSRKYLYERIFDLVLYHDSVNKLCKELIEIINMRGNEREM